MTPCVCALRLPPPAPARPVVARWTCAPSGNVIYLCWSCLHHWLDNADDDPDLEPASLELLELRRIEPRAPAEHPGVAAHSDADIARAFHEAYERLAPAFGYRTRESGAKPWEDVPLTNRGLMIATVREVRALLGGADNNNNEGERRG